MIRQFVQTFTLYLLFTKIVQAKKQEKPTTCSNILPTYHFSSDVRFDTKTLFEFVDALPNDRGKKHNRALISNTRRRCGLVKNLNKTSEITDQFRKACYAVKQTFSHARAPPPNLNEAKNPNEKAVRAALIIANAALRKAWRSCDELCPCLNNGTICTSFNFDNGDCVMPPKAIPIQQNHPSVVSLQSVHSSPEPISIEILTTAEPVIENLPSTPEPLQPVVIVRFSPEPSTVVTEISIQSTPEPMIVANNEIAAAAAAQPSSSSSVSDDSAEKGAAENLTAETLSDSSTELVSKSGLSVGAIVGIALAATVVVSAMALVAVSNFAYRRRHSEDLDQWRQAFRVVE